MDAYSVLIVDDDWEWCSELSAHLEQFPILNVLQPARTGDVAFQQIKSVRPDAIILDLLLPVNDGLFIIDYIDKEMPDYRPVIYVMSMFGTEKIRVLLRDYGMVNYYSIKPVNLTSATNALIAFLTGKSVYQDINGIIEDIGSSSLVGLDMIVEDYLRKMGIGTASLQAKCTRVAIEICIQMDKDVRVHRMGLYKETGERFTPPLSVSAVERNIRAAVQKILDKRTPLFEKYFPPHGVSVNSGTFVLESANMLRRRIVENGNGALLGEQNSAFSRKRR